MVRATQSRTRWRPTKKAAVAPSVAELQTIATPWAKPNTAPAPRASTDPGRSSPQAIKYNTRKTQGANGPRPQIHERPVASQAPASRARPSRRSTTTAATSRSTFMAGSIVPYRSPFRVRRLARLRLVPLRLVPDDGPRGQGDDDPERQIHQQEVDGEHRT